MAAPSVSVVVTTYGRAERLAAVLPEVLARTVPAEVVVVDDGSQDTTPELLARLATHEPRLHVVTQENCGQSLALVAGAAAASGEVVLLLDDDVLPADGVVAGHAAHHADGTGLVVVGHMPVAPGPVTLRSWPRDIYARSYDDHVDAWEAAPETVLTRFWAGHMSLRRADMLALAGSVVGGPLGYGRDMDLGLCAAELGLVGRFDRSLGGQHLLDRTPEAFARNARSSGHDMAEVEARHPAGGSQLEQLPAPVTRLLKRPHAAPRLAWGIGVAVTALGLVRAYETQRRAAGKLWRVIQCDAYARRAAELCS